jgi:hypothetical protein
MKKNIDICGTGLSIFDKIVIHYMIDKSESEKSLLFYTFNTFAHFQNGKTVFEN